MSRAASGPVTGRGGAGAPAYRHTQSGLTVVALVASGAVATLVVAATSLAGRAAPPAVWAVVAIATLVLLGSAAVFSSLTVEVDAETLHWHFAFGALRRTVPLAEVARAEATRTTLLDGVGIHIGPRGWVYNVAFGPAVRVVRHDGRAFLLGTDDPGGLAAALGGALAPR